MNNKFKNRYRIGTPRLKGYDYSSSAMYYITICTKGRKNYFGKIINKKMIPSLIGEIAIKEWYKSSKIRPDMNIDFGDFVIMPNHIHGIIIIGINDFNFINGRITMHRDSAGHRDSTVHRDSTINNPSLYIDSQTNQHHQNKFGPQSKNVASIIRGFKSSVTQYARKNMIEFSWQSGFYDHIIRDEKDFIRISDYINNNPMKWIKK